MSIEPDLEVHVQKVRFGRGNNKKFNLIRTTTLPESGTRNEESRPHFAYTFDGLFTLPRNKRSCPSSPPEEGSISQRDFCPNHDFFTHPGGEVSLGTPDSKTVSDPEWVEER